MTDKEAYIKWIKLWISQNRSQFDNNLSLIDFMYYSIPADELFLFARFDRLCGDLRSTNVLKSREDIPQELKLEVLLLVGDKS